ncbi:hypothetical protein [Pseudobacteriovorax antillogorgiicola]|uniref:DUF5723 domain-containing protein n=1 Tax=Pseudobacteriovorax antillogorgiicola TaxID=1513793 RepID=A0A1Y6CJZ3_9BACT|nr:hypothetical protein [Pseudobacteriovorax antillogorgiicola]TCS46187.1 hypothetical protein EDD56_12588 [Pseudobacteriovorax antillogorgiicola]SMF70083.1 hypothetical protein SAMN06296036_12588 [Pseudobacteriovorax antillogorgiicola]
MPKYLWIFSIVIATEAWSRNLADPVYIEPFDRGAGGTVLTRASREGILFGNPALLGLGKSWLRWGGLQTTIKPSGDIDKIQSALNSDVASSGTGTTNLQDEGGTQVDISQLEALDLGIGTELTISILNQNGGGGIFVDGGAYLRYDSFGDTGIPGARIAVDAIGGAALSGAFSPLRWLHLGATQKFLYGVEKNLFITPFNAEDAIAEAQDVSSYGQGTGTDVGALIYLKDFTVDYSLGLTVKNLTPVKFTDNRYPTLPQTKNIGLGVTLHTEGNAIHFSGELHDVDGNSGESLARRLHLGVRFLLWQTLGVSAGVYHNKPSYGLKLDLLLIKIGLSSYYRVVGFGSNSFERPEYTITFSVGI